MSALLDLCFATLRNLRAHALRFFLTSLGIFWGAAMLTYLSAATNGQQAAFESQLERTGPKIVWAMPGVLVKDRVGERGARPLELEPEDVEHVAAFDVVVASSVELNLWNQVVRSPGRTRLLSVVGIDADGLAIRNFEVAAGRHFAAYEVERAEPVAFLGATAKERLFGARAAVGRSIHIEGQRFRVVGVAAAKGDQLMYMGEADDRVVLIPTTAAMRQLAHTDRVPRFIAEPRRREDSSQVATAIRSLLGLRHDFAPSNELALNFVDVQQVWSVLDGLFAALELFMYAAGLVTLLVGAIGVMNIMLVVVGERTQEIGLRKALGASDRAIFALFLSEAMAVATLSGVAGALFGFLLTEATAMAARAGADEIPVPVFDLENTLVVVCSLIGVGIVAGVVPALRAARVAPAESLRSVA